MIEVLSALSPVLVALTTGLMGVVLARVNARVKKAEEQDKQIESIKNNQKAIAKNLELITELNRNHAHLSAESSRLGSGMRILLRSSMQSDHQRLMDQGYVTSHQLRDFEEAYDVYHQEGGNGTATRWLEDLRSLPIRDADFSIHPMEIRREGSYDD